MQCTFRCVWGGWGVFMGVRNWRWEIFLDCFSVLCFSHFKKLWVSYIYLVDFSPYHPILSLTAPLFLTSPPTGFLRLPFVCGLLTHLIFWDRVSSVNLKLAIFFQLTGQGALSPGSSSLHPDAGVADTCTLPFFFLWVLGVPPRPSSACTMSVWPSESPPRPLL